MGLDDFATFLCAILACPSFTYPGAYAVRMDGT